MRSIWAYLASQCRASACDWHISRLLWGTRKTARQHGHLEAQSSYQGNPQLMPAELTDAPSRGAMICTHVRHSHATADNADLDAPHMDEATGAQTLAATKRQAVPGALMRWVMSTSASRSYQALEDTCASLRTSGTAVPQP